VASSADTRFWPPNGGFAPDLTSVAPVALNNVTISRKVDVAGGGVTTAAACSESSGPVGADAPAVTAYVDVPPGSGASTVTVPARYLV
jgi:hypothetical protein